MRRPDELIRAIRIPLPLAPLAAFHKIAKRRFDDISSVAVGYAFERGRTTSSAKPGSGSAEWPRRRSALSATEAALEGQPWTAETAREAGAVLRREGTPIDDHRASAAFRVEMLGQSLLQAVRRAPRTGREEATMTIAAYDHSRSRREASDERPLRTPGTATVGVAIPHESATLHVTGDALYTDDLVLRTKDVLHAYPVQVMHAHARVTALRTEPALLVPGVVRVLTAADVPGVNDAGVKHDEPLFPDEIMFYGHAVCWVLGETLEAARLGAVGRRGGHRIRCRRS